MRNQFEALFESHSPKWKEWDKRLRGDAWESDLDLLLAKFLSELQTSLNSSDVGLDVRKWVEQLSEAIAAFVTEEVARQFDVMLGERFYGGDIWWATVKKEWINLVEKRVAGQADLFFRTLQEKVFEMVKEDTPFNEIYAVVKEELQGFPEKTARFLARDLTSKLNSSITRNLHASIGIELYLWQTMADERVRGNPAGKYPKAVPSHWEMEGKVCAWKDPTVYSSDAQTWVPRTGKMPRAAPGEEWLCRCIPVPFLGELVREADEQIAREEGDKA